VDAVAIVDGTLVPTRDHRLATPSKNYRYSANVQVAIDAETRLVIATGDPRPGSRNDSRTGKKISTPSTGRSGLASRTSWPG
jgi:hypothetical protein